MGDETQQEETKPVTRKKTTRASGKSSGGGNQPVPKETPEARQTTSDGKPIRKTASGFVVVG